MKRIVLSIVGGFLMGILCTLALFSPHVLAQNRVHPTPPFANERFMLVDENQATAGELSFDAAGMPMMRFRGDFGRLGGRILHVMCEIRPWGVATPLDGQ
jgi:hypothetical protein